MSWRTGSASEEAAGLQHGELEEQLDVRGRALLRQLFQDRLDLTAAREERRHDVTGPDGVPRTRAEKGRTRPLVTRFGQVTVSRIAYRSPGRSNVHPLDAALNLPEEKHSHGLRKLAAVEAARGSIEAAGDAVARATGVRIGKRQLEELARRAAAHVDAFYLQRVIEPGAGGLAAGADLRREGHRDAAGGAAPGHREGRRRGAGQARDPAVARGEERPEADGRAGLRLRRRPGPAHPRRTIISTPAQKSAQKRRKNEGAGRQAEGQAEAAGAAGAGQVADRLGHRRHPRRHRRRLRRGRTPRPAAQAGMGRSSIDGNNTQIEAVTAEAARRGITVTIVIDFIHVLEYLWKAAWSFFDKGEPAAEEWVADQARKILHAASRRRSRPGSAAAPPPTATPRPSAPAPTNAARYLDNKKDYLGYATALEKGWPIATGIIEGAARWLVKDRMDITGARWGLEGAEAILKLRALIASGDFDAYWRFHLRREHERIHHARYRDGLVLAA